MQIYIFLQNCNFARPIQLSDRRGPPITCPSIVSPEMICPVDTGQNCQVSNHNQVRYSIAKKTEVKSTKICQYETYTRRSTLLSIRIQMISRLLPISVSTFNIGY